MSFPEPALVPDRQIALPLRRLLVGQLLEACCGGDPRAAARLGLDSHEAEAFIAEVRHAVEMLKHDAGDKELGLALRDARDRLASIKGAHPHITRIRREESSRRISNSVWSSESVNRRMPAR